jgi:hypothetical protein
MPDHALLDRPVPSVFAAFLGLSTV